MSNTFMNGLKSATNYTRTENGALTHKSTMSGLLDLFAMGAAYRTRSDEDVITLFKKAYDEDAVHALKCLFYIRDIRGGQGERRFFRVVTKWLSTYDIDAMRRNLIHVPEYGRWDDLFIFIGTPLETDALNVIKHQLALDVQCKTPSLLGKWMPSENTSSKKTRATAAHVRKYIGMTPKQYRQTLSVLRKRINVLERLMSEGRWDEIEFDKIPSKAGLKYKNAFARHDIERLKRDPQAQTYEAFAKDTTTKVNAKALYPYEVVHDALELMGNKQYYWDAKRVALDDTQRLMINKYWDNLEDYFKGATFDGIAMADTSGSMCSAYGVSVAPIEVAVSLAMYCAEKNKGAFANHFISFESNPHLIEVEGVDFCDKVHRITGTDWGGSTNVEAAMDLILETGIRNGCSQAEMPKNLVITTDMQFNCVRTSAGYGSPTDTLFEKIAAKFRAHGYEMPHLIFWNVNCRQNDIPMLGTGYVSYVSGFSPSIFETIMSGKTGVDLMLEKLDSERYAPIH